MKRFVAGADRTQSRLLPECLDDFIDESNPVRVIDAFVDALNLAELGFDGLEPAAVVAVARARGLSKEAT
jgi:transposase